MLFLGLLTRVLLPAAEPKLLTLETSLRLAGVANLSLQIARERVVEARSLYEQQRQSLFPWLAPGLAYKRHAGALQDIGGSVFDASKQLGSGQFILQTQLELGETIYRTLASKQIAEATEAASQARRREILLAVAVAYWDLSRATVAVATTEESRRLSIRLLEQVSQAVKVGVAFAGDIERVRLQLERTESQCLQSRMETGVATTRLAQLLRLPSEIHLEPDLTEFIPVILVGTNRSVGSLIASALGLRPELRQSRALIAAARAQHNGVTKGPWIPGIGAQVGVGGLSGGRNGNFGGLDDFQDYGLGVSWRIGPGGIGDRQRIRTATARLRIAELDQEKSGDDIRAEVIEAQIRAAFAGQQLTSASRMISAAQRLVEFTRTRQKFGVGEVMEAIDAEGELTRSKLAHLQAVAEYNRRQWQLWQASGLDISSDKSR